MTFSARPAHVAGRDLIVALGVLMTPMATYAQVDARVEVLVVARGTTSPVAGAGISVAGSGTSGSTATDGTATLSGLAPGRHTIAVAALGFADRTVDVDLVNGRTTRITVALDMDPIQLRGLEVRSPRSALPGAGVAIDIDGLDATITDLPAAIGRVPGATVVRTGGPGSPTTVQLRGSSSSQVLVLLDGVAINSPVTGTADLSTVDLRSLERVVVLPGAQSARYGPRALGGVILLETRRPTGASMSATVGAGAWGTRELSASGTWRAGRTWRVSAGARWDEAAGDFAYDVPVFRGGGEDTRANARHERVGGDIRVERSGAVTTSLRLHGSTLERGSPGSIVQPSTTGGQQHDRHGGTFDALLGTSRAGGSLRIGMQWQHATYADSTPPFGAAYDAATEAREDRFGAEGWTDVGPIGVRGGVDAVRTSVRSTSVTPGTLRIDATGVWARGELGRAAGGFEVEAGLGARLDAHDLVDGVTASPSADLTVTRHGTTIALGWANGFSPPGLGDLFFQEGVLVEPNPDLLPERVRNELSVSLAHTLQLDEHSVELRTSAYDADVEDMILWFPDYRFVWSPVNFDVVRSGLEVGASATVVALGGAHGMTANAAWSRVEYSGDALEGQVAYRPDFTADVTLSVSLPFATLSPTWRHVGERRSAPGSELNVLTPYDLLDIGLTLPFMLGTASARLDLLASNVLDERAALLVDYPLPGRGWSARLRITPDH